MFAHVYVDSKIERDEPLIYRVPIEHIPKIVRGSLVIVSLRNKKNFGVVFKITKGHNLGQLRSPVKPLISVLTNFPIIQPYQWELAHWLADAYLINVAQALFLILPSFSKTVLKNTLVKPGHQIAAQRSPSVRQIVGHNFESRFSWYQKVVNVYQKRGYSVLLLVPSIEQFPLLRRFFPKAFFFDSGLSRTKKTKTWLECLSGPTQVIVGTRSALFLPLSSYRLIICDRPYHPGFFEDRQPRYTAWQIAIQLSQIIKFDLVFGDEVAIPLFQDDKPIRWISQVRKPKITITTPSIHQSIITTLVHRLQTDKVASCLIMVPNKGEAIGYRCLDCLYTSAILDSSRCQQCRSARLKPFGFTTKALKQSLVEQGVGIPFHIVDLDHLYNIDKPFVIATQKIFDYDVRFDYSFVVGIESKVRSPDPLSPELSYRYIKHIINRTNKEVTIFSRGNLGDFLFPIANDQQAYYKSIELRKQLNAYPFGHIIRLNSTTEPSSQLMQRLKTISGIIHVIPPHRTIFNRDSWQALIATQPSFRFTSLKSIERFMSNIKIDIDPLTML